jgi:hypothetical protein
MKRIIVLVMAAVLSLACSSGGTDNSSTDSGPTSSETDGVESDSVVDVGPPQPCQFQPPIGASCNPYPQCPSSGCASGDMCTVVVYGDMRRVECHAVGTVSLGGSCDHEEGPFCASGVCVDSECRSFCVDSPDCGGTAACGPMLGVPGKPNVCGPTMQDCDPLDPIGSCVLGTACYWQNTGTDCLEVQQAGQQNTACSCPNCCSPGFACVVHEGTQLCAQVCLTEGETSLCNEACSGLKTKILGGTLGACVPAADNPDPPPEAPTCDIVQQDCEGVAQACYSTNKGDVCLVKGNKVAGEMCENTNDCVKGVTCFAGKCYTVCDPVDESNALCETGFNAKCTPLSNSAGGFCDE